MNVSSKAFILYHKKAVLSKQAKTSTLYKLSSVIYYLLGAFVLFVHRSYYKSQAVSLVVFASGLNIS